MYPLNSKKKITSITIPEELEGKKTKTNPKNTWVKLALPQGVMLFV